MFGEASTPPWKLEEEEGKEGKDDRGSADVERVISQSQLRDPLILLSQFEAVGGGRAVEEEEPEYVEVEVKGQ